MARRLVGGFLVAASLLPPVAGGAGPPVPNRHHAVYDFYLGGLRAGLMTIEAEIGAGHYRVALSGRTAGIIGLFLRANAEAEAVGAAGAAGLTPRQFTAHTREWGRRQSVAIAYLGGSPVSVAAQPARPIRAPPAAAIDPRGEADPLTAALQALAPAPADELCSRTAAVFDGERRWAVELGPPVETGERLRCDAAYVRVAGFAPALSQRRPFAIFFEDRGDGLFHAVRAVGKTSFGLAVLLLRDE